MSAVVVATAYGGPEVLSVIDEPPGEPGPGEVLVRLRAAGVNPIDHKTYSGLMGSDPGLLPKRLGTDGAGVVTAVGPDAVGPRGPVSVGDEVILYPVAGTYAEHLVVRASSVIPKPAQLDWPVAGSLIVVGVTAVHVLEAVGLADGDTVLVHGGSGAVGLVAVQLAVARGARVVATARPAKHALLRELGAEPVAYGDGLAARVRAIAPQVDAAVDLVGTDEAVDVSLELVADRQRIATIAAFGRAGAVGIKLLGGGPGADPGDAIRGRARLEIPQLVADGSVHLPIAGTYPLREAAAAHRASLAGHDSGKLVLLP